jgi:hypothetical protein
VGGALRGGSGADGWQMHASYIAVVGAAPAACQRRAGLARRTPQAGDWQSHHGGATGDPQRMLAARPDDSGGVSARHRCEGDSGGGAGSGGRPGAEGREKTAILAACRADDSPAGPRDAAIFGLAVYAGLRRAEIAGLDLENYNADDQVMRVKGKGNKTRTVPLTGGLADALDEWLALRGKQAGYLFLAVNKGGRVLDKGISDAAIYNLLLKRAQQAGVKKFSPHDGRRSFAGDLLDAGADVVTVQKLMGHADTNTTGKYDRRGERAKAQAVSRLHMGWERR